MSELTEKFLDEIYEFKSGLSKPREEFGFGHGFVSFKDVFYNYFIPETLTELVNTSDQEQESCSVKRGDVFLTRTSETFNELGMSSVALKDYPKATFNGFTKRLRPKSTDEIWPEYIGYYFRSASFRNIVSSMATMTTRASLNNEILSRLKVKYPPLPEQKAIAHILGTLDEKIELNRKMNQTLEAMAQALFKSWFVDFDPVIDNALAQGKEIPEELEARAEKRRRVIANREERSGKQSPSSLKPLLSTNPSLAAQFPASFVFNETLGKWIPEGWEVKFLGSCVDTVLGGTPSTKNESYWTNGTIGWLNSGKVNEFRILQPTQLITEEALNNSATKLMPTGTTLLAITGATLGQISRIERPFCANQSVVGIIGNKYLSNEFIYLWIHQNIHFLTQNATGGAQQHVNKNNVNELQIILPTQQLRDSFDKEILSMFTKISINCSEVETLTQLRDRLLSELISGRVRVPKGFSN